MGTKVIVGIFLTIFGIVFLIVGISFVRASSATTQETDYIETLPLLNATQLQDTRAGTEAVIEGRIAERNALHDNGFVTYIRSEYQGERCTEDDDGNEDCEEIWIEDERITPTLWLDLTGGRTHFVNTNYELQNVAVTVQSTDTLIEKETRRYEGFKIGNPIFTKGIVTADAEGPALNADFIYGGNRNIYLTNQRNQAGNSLLGGIIFSAFGGVAIIAGGILLFIGFK